MRFFRIHKKSTKSKARLGTIHTPHGEISTPSFVPVATKGTLKSIPPRELKSLGVQVAFVNTFHLAVHPGVDVVQKFGGIHEYSKMDIPLMSDSAGFQVFSLGRVIKTREGDEAKLLKITDRGVKFRSPRGGKELNFTPESSIKSQEKIGADLIMAFDECIPYGVDYEYTKEATDRTHQWLLRCIKARKRRDQYLYGIVQGGVYKDLREESAQFVAKQHVDGIAIGGVSVGETKKEMRDQVKWVTPFLPEDLPKHLLGIGRVDDILDLVREGMDTFDCVEPTRIARNGLVYVQKGKKVERVDVTKTSYKTKKIPIEKDCPCYACQNFSLSFIHHLFKERELLGYYLASAHNTMFFTRLFQYIREEIKQGNM
ncbi:MAG: tRNA guanosine(34) transglycosylase Tgt [archaeon]|nr:tRNA guanosine(34) transglycosylase Tgt [archaeon]